MGGSGMMASKMMRGMSMAERQMLMRTMEGMSTSEKKTMMNMSMTEKRLVMKMMKNQAMSAGAGAGVGSVGR
jgi:hypothetical protein